MRDRLLLLFAAALCVCALDMACAGTARALEFVDCDPTQRAKISEVVSLVLDVVEREKGELVRSYAGKPHPLVDAYFDTDRAFDAETTTMLEAQLAKVVRVLQLGRYRCGELTLPVCPPKVSSGKAWAEIGDPTLTINICAGSFRADPVRFAGLLAHEAFHLAMEIDDLFDVSTQKETGADTYTVAVRADREAFLVSVRDLWFDGGFVDARAWGGFISTLIGHHFDRLYDLHAWRGTTGDDLEKELALIAGGADRHRELINLHQFLSVSRSSFATPTDLFSFRRALVLYSDFWEARCVAMAAEEQVKGDPLGGSLRDFLVFVEDYSPRCTRNPLGVPASEWSDSQGAVAARAAEYWRSAFAAKFSAIF